MIRFLVSAAASGSGKTVATCALLAALQKRGLSPCAFKCGPDYIDPMFHRAVLGVESRNLDLFLADEETVRRLFDQGSMGHGAAVCEGAMGYYDGVGGVTDQASAWHMAQTLAMPTVLVARPAGSSLTLAAQLRGIRDFRGDSRIKAILLNDCTPSLCRQLSPMLEKETGVPVVGCLPRLPEARFESRHLGLYTAAEIEGLTAKLHVLAETLEENADLDRLVSLCDDGCAVKSATKTAVCPKPVALHARIAVARDEAFCFTYAETLEALEAAGAELVFFSPLRDAALPLRMGGLYLPGGYPELYARQLSENRTMLAAVQSAVQSGIPTVAECGGFLYLEKSLESDDGEVYPMADVLPGAGLKTSRLVRFGYALLTAQQDSLLLRAGESVPVHEFHHWDSTDNGNAFHLEKPVVQRNWQGGFASDTLYAAFAHLYFAGQPKLAERFVTAAANYLGD